MKKIISLSVLVMLAVVMSMYVLSKNADSQTAEVGTIVKSGPSMNDRTNFCCLRISIF